MISISVSANIKYFSHLLADIGYLIVFVHLYFLHLDVFLDVQSEYLILSRVSNTHFVVNNCKSLFITPVIRIIVAHFKMNITFYTLAKIIMMQHKFNDSISSI